MNWDGLPTLCGPITRLVKLLQHKLLLQSQLCNLCKIQCDITLTYNYVFWNLKLVMLVISDSILNWVCIFSLSHLAFIILERTVLFIEQCKGEGIKKMQLDLYATMLKHQLNKINFFPHLELSDNCWSFCASEEEKLRRKTQ